MMPDELVKADRAHLIHPLHSVSAHDSLGPLVLVRGRARSSTTRRAASTLTDYPHSGT